NLSPGWTPARRSPSSVARRRPATSSSTGSTAYTGRGNSSSSSCGVRPERARSGPTPGATTDRSGGMVQTTEVFAALRRQRIETPSWAYGNSGTRFKVFPQEGVPRDPYEKIADAATVHRFTGVAPSVALHIPWDKVDDWPKFSRYAADQGVRLGTINSNVFQDPDYMLGSVTNPDPRVRRKA